MVVKGERFGKWGAMVGILLKSFWILQKNGENQFFWLPNESESAGRSDETLNGQVNVKWALEWIHKVPWERKRLNVLTEWREFGLLGPLCGRSPCPEGVLTGIHVHLLWESEYESCTCRKWRRAEVIRKSPCLWLKYGNWWSRDSGTPL